MKSFYVGLTVVLISLAAQAGGRRAYVPEPAPVVIPTPLASPSPTVGEMVPLVTIGRDTGSNVNRAFAQKALDKLNAVYWNGCLFEGITKHRFQSLHTAMATDPRNSADAYAIFVAGAPYALDLRWYQASASRVIGYTYNFLSDTDWDAVEGASETHIWSNTKYISLTDSASYASHLTHELSHQGRTGAYVHYTIFGGSFPYDVGDIAYDCINRL